MASADAQADDDFDFADDTAVDEQADFDWDDLDEPEQSPAAKAAPKPATTPPAAAPTPLPAAAAAPQPTPIVTKVGPIPFRDPSPPASSSPAAPLAAAGSPGVARKPSTVLPGAAPSSSRAVAGSPASALPQRPLAGAASASAKPGPPPPRAMAPSAAPPATSLPAAAGAAAAGAAGPSPVRASTPPARQYSHAAGQPVPGPTPSLAGSLVSPQQNPNTAAPAVGPPAPTYASTGRPAAQAAAGPRRVTTTPAATQPALVTAAASGRAEAAANVPQPAFSPGAPAAASNSTVPGQNTPAAESAAFQPALAQETKQPTDAQPSKTAPAAAAVASAPAPQGSSRAGGGGGWGGWGFGGLTNKLQQVALGAAKDLQELTASVQQAVAEVVAADDVSEVERLSAYQERPSRPGPAPPAGAAAPPAAVTVSRGDSMPHLSGTQPGSGDTGPAAGHSSPTNKAASVAATELDPEEQKRQEVLNRLQGQDTQLESGLKAIDDQVDLIAASAAKALGSLWGGFSTVAKQTVTVGAAITAKVEAAAKEVAKEIAVGLEEGAQAVATPGVPGGSGISLREAAHHLAARAERTLESVGRGAVSLLDPQSGRSWSSGSQQHMGRSPSDWAATFDSCFELYGGQQAAEELEQLSSECAHICNRARANLQLEAKQQIDATLSKLAPAFDLRSNTEQQNASASSSAEDEHMQEAFEQLYLPIRSICNKGNYRASQLQQEATDAAPEAAAAEARAVESGAAADAGSTAEIQPDNSAGKQQADGTAGDDGSSTSSDSSKLEQLLQRLLAGLRSVAVKSLAEVSAGQLMLLLSLGRSLAALPRYGKPLNDGLEWPADPEAVAQLMQQQACAMLADMQQLAGVFKATAPAIVHALQDAAAAHGQLALARINSELAAEQAKAAADEVEADCGSALAYVKDGFGKLLYVVLLASLHRAGLQEQHAQQAKSADSSGGSDNTAAAQQGA